MKDKLTKVFLENYKQNPDYFISCGGRFEILGNHTDHNHGLCLAATCNLCISAALTKNDDLIVRLVSEGNPSFEIDLSNLEIKEEEKFTSQALIRGVTRYLKDRGYNIGGFNVYMESSIFPGAGVSSSAAFELLTAQIFNELFNENKIEKILLCKAGQYAENEYFGKKSGLLDQIGVAFGGIAYIDFNDIVNPIVDPIQIDFDGLHYVIVNTGGSHADLSDLYSEIPLDLYTAAKSAGVNFLRDTTLESLNKENILERQYNRAIHFYSECERVSIAKKAILEHDLATFLKMINESRASSTNYLKNMMAFDVYEGSPLEAADLGMNAMNNEGAIKINGGGFAGSIICFVPDEHLSNFIKVMSNKYGEHNVKEVSVRPVGPGRF